MIICEKMLSHKRARLRRLGVSKRVNHNDRFNGAAVSSLRLRFYGRLLKVLGLQVFKLGTRHSVFVDKILTSSMVFQSEKLLTWDSLIDVVASGQTLLRLCHLHAESAL